MSEQPTPIMNPIPKHDDLKKLWVGTCNIYNYERVTDENHQTTTQKVLVYENEPCRLSYSIYHSSANITNVTSGVAMVGQIIKVFIRPDIEIKPGSEIVVTQHGRTETFYRSGQPAVYTNHQEIMLNLDKDV